MEPIVNKVTNSALVTLDLEDYIPKTGDIYRLDVVDGLYEGLILREKEFRAWISAKAKEIIQPIVYVSNTSDGILPNWVFMLVSSVLNKESKQVFIGSEKDCLEAILMKRVDQEFLSTLKSDKIVVKGCAKVELTQEFYGRLVQLLIPHATSIMYGEPCSTVPIYKAQKKP